jgi:hypothetical protein
MPEIAGAGDIGAYRDKCLDIADLAPTALARMQACRLGAPAATPDFLLIGDSHAASLADGLNVAALRAGRGGIVIAANACMPLIGLGSTYPRSRSYCRRLHADMFDIVDKLGIKLVLLHARWQAMDEPIAFSEAADESRSPRDRLHERLLETLKAFASRGVAVKIVGGTPRAPYRVPDILARKAYFGLDVEERPGFQQFRFENRTAISLFAEPEVRRYAEIFELYPFFCREGESGHCAVAEGSRPYFFDDSHLSLFGSLALAPLLQGLFE